MSGEKLRTERDDLVLTDLGLALLKAIEEYERKTGKKVLGR